MIKNIFVHASSWLVAQIKLQLVAIINILMTATAWGTAIYIPINMVLPMLNIPWLQAKHISLSQCISMMAIILFVAAFIAHSKHPPHYDKVGALIEKENK